MMIQALTLLIAALIGALSLMGWGTALDFDLRRWAGARRGGEPDGPDSPAPDPGLAGLMGLPVVIILALAVNWVRPLEGAPVVVLAGAGLLLLLLGPGARRLRGRRGLMAVTGFAVLAAMLILGHAGPLAWNYDLSWYHYPNMAWMLREPTTLGMALVNSRIGFNSAFDVFAATLWLPGIGPLGPLAAPPTLIALGLLHLFAQLRRARPGAGGGIVGAGFALIAGMLILGLQQPMTARALYKPDMAAAIVWLAALATALRLPAGGRAARADTARLAVLVGLGVAIRPGLAPLGLLALAPLFAGLGWRACLRAGLAGLAPAALLVGLDLARTFAATGCLVMPVAMTCDFDRDFALPPAEIAEHKAIIARFAREQPWTENQGAQPPLDSSEARGWPRRWLATQFGLRQTPLASLTVASLLAALGLATSAFARPPPPAPGHRPLLLLAGGTILAGLVFVGITAPLPRFAYGPLVALPAWLGAVALDRWLRARPARLPAPRHLRAGALGLWVLAGAVGLLTAMPWQRDSESIGAEGWPWVDRPVIVPRRTAHGDLINWPRRSEHCWWADPPCIQYWDDHLDRHVGPPPRLTRHPPGEAMP